VTPISCHGTCCAQGEVCRDEGICCPAGTPICSSVLGPVCCHGGACDQNGACCNPETGHLCPGSNICCGFGVCCGSACCNVGEVCLSNRDGPIGCCPASRACGQGGDNAVCCPVGQMCVNQQESTCAPCPTGLFPCSDPSNPGTAVCCPLGSACCNGACCPLGLICCIHFGFGCHTPEECAPR
jgi:hypothetical protein